MTYTLSAASPPYRAGHFSTLLLQDCALNRGPRQWQLLLKNGACNLILLSFSTPSPSRDTNRYIKVRLNIAQFRCLLPIWRSATGSFASILFMVFISASHWFLVLAAGRMLDILDPGSSLTSNSRMILAYSQPIRSVCCNMASRLIFFGSSDSGKQQIGQSPRKLLSGCWNKISSSNLASCNLFCVAACALSDI